MSTRPKERPGHWPWQRAPDKREAHHGSPDPGLTPSPPLAASPQVQEGVQNHRLTQEIRASRQMSSRKTKAPLASMDSLGSLLRTPQRESLDPLASMDTLGSAGSLLRSSASSHSSLPRKAAVGSWRYDSLTSLAPLPRSRCSSGASLSRNTSVDSMGYMDSLTSLASLPRSRCSSWTTLSRKASMDSLPCLHPEQLSCSSSMGSISRKTYTSSFPEPCHGVMAEVSVSTCSEHPVSPAAAKRLVGHPGPDPGQDSLLELPVGTKQVQVPQHEGDRTQSPVRVETSCSRTPATDISTNEHVLKCFHAFQAAEASLRQLRKEHMKAELARRQRALGASVKAVISNMEQDLEVFQEQAGTKASPCETGLQELVHQIDIMINSKKMEWERKMKALEAKVDIQDKELASAQSKLDQKGQEIGLLRQKLEDLQKTKYEMAQNYETQLQALKSQFSKLAHSYEKLQSHQLKQKKAEGREGCEESLETPSAVSSLYKQLEELKAKSGEWDKKRTICQNYLLYLDAQQKLLSEKCDLFQKQTQNYRFQISNEKKNQEGVITCGQPESENDELIMEKLKTTVNEIAINNNKLEEENLKLREDIKMYQNHCQNMEAGLSEMRNELQSRDALWRRIQLECQQLHTELLKVKEHKDMQEIQIKHQSSCVQLTEQLENKNAELLLLAQSQEHQREELNKIRNHLYHEEQSHRSEQERMKTEISDLTEELHQKDITIATILEKASLLDRRLKMELEIKDKLLAKQQFLDFQYQVIKSENIHLKEMVENQECKSCMIIDFSNKEHGNFSTSVHKFKHENVRLQNSLVELQNGTETSTLRLMDTRGETEHNFQTCLKMQEKVERTFQKKDAWEMEQQQTAVLTANGYHRNCCPSLYGQGSITGSKSDSTLSSYTLERGHETKPDDKSPSPAGYPLGFGGLCPEKATTGSLLSPAYNAEEIQLSPPPELSFLATTEKFLQQEEKHTREFEERLNLHIEELQRHSENTVKNYARSQQCRHT
ncbi:deuterosome assembly protein 1 [Apus apus]|uniref:deuterosome assembly protein 1 n=1 Tax=Apus apus TaxID=8895 RepID=UPI0021F89B0B|nr:deuterosome assembly protein 1 [Apus apus]